MPTFLQNIKRMLYFLLGVLIITACTPAQGKVAASKTTAITPPGFADPFDYCAAAGTIDKPDARFTGQNPPDAVIKGLMKASGAAPDMPVEVFSRGTFWRCMDQQVYACFVGANLPCESKANTSQEPTAEMGDYCKANPASDFIPAAATGHETIYAWACKDGKAVAGKQVFQVDKQGYIQEIWYKIVP